MQIRPAYSFHVDCCEHARAFRVLFFVATDAVIASRNENRKPWACGAGRGKWLSPERKREFLRGRNGH